MDSDRTIILKAYPDQVPLSSTDWEGMTGISYITLYFPAEEKSMVIPSGGILPITPLDKIIGYALTAWDIPLLERNGYVLRQNKIADLIVPVYQGTWYNLSQTPGGITNLYLPLNRILSGTLNIPDYEEICNFQMITKLLLQETTYSQGTTLVHLVNQGIYKLYLFFKQYNYLLYSLSSNKGVAILRR